MQVFFIQLFTTATSFSEKINVEADINRQDTLAVISIQEHTEAHEFFESTLEWLFSKAPYIIIQPSTDSSLLIPPSEISPQLLPNYQMLEEKKYSYLLQYELIEDEETYTIAYNLYDSLYQELSLTKSYTFTKSELLRATKSIATEVFFKLTAEFPFFIGKMFYTERSPQSGRQYILSKSIEGKRTQYTSPQTLLTSPSYCNGNRIFVSIKEENQLMNIQQINVETLTRSDVNLPRFLKEANLSSPKISKDCHTLLFSASRDGSSQIYKYHIPTQELKQITKDNNLNIKGTFGKDGTIYYVSNKYGSPKIFAKSPDGREGLISRGMGSYISFDVSPDGKKIAFTKIFNGNFYAGAMNTDGSSEILFKSGYIIESPSWAPYGRNFIVSVQESSKPERTVYSISSLTGTYYPLSITSKNAVQVDWVMNQSDTIKPNN